MSVPFLFSVVLLLGSAGERIDTGVLVASEIEIRLDVEMLQKWGVAVADANKSIEMYLKTHDSFTPSDLERIKVKDITGKEHSLKDFAVVKEKNQKK